MVLCVSMCLFTSHDCWFFLGYIATEKLKATSDPINDPISENRGRQ